MQWDVMQRFASQHLAKHSSTVQSSSATLLPCQCLSQKSQPSQPGFVASKQPYAAMLGTGTGIVGTVLLLVGKAYSHPT